MVQSPRDFLGEYFHAQIPQTFLHHPAPARRDRRGDHRRLQRVAARRLCFARSTRRSMMYRVEDQPRIAIVFGAGLTRSGEPTPALYDRVATAVDLYQRGLVNKLLLTGDNRFINYNEPEAMRRTAVKLGVPDEDLVLDYAGRRTYDSCYRAREIFGVNHAILVTQAFHLDRALYLCDTFGIDSVGVVADRRNYTASAQTWWSIREAVATVGRVDRCERDAAHTRVGRPASDRELNTLTEPLSRLRLTYGRKRPHRLKASPGAARPERKGPRDVQSRARHRSA